MHYFQCHLDTDFLNIIIIIITTVLLTVLWLNFVYRPEKLKYSLLEAIICNVDSRLIRSCGLSPGKLLRCKPLTIQRVNCQLVQAFSFFVFCFVGVVFWGFFG